MKGLNFDSSGRLIVPNGAVSKANSGNRSGNMGLSSYKSKFEPIISEDEGYDEPLRTTDSLKFLREGEKLGEANNSVWSLYENKKKLLPLKFSNGKSQEDIVNEIVGHIKSGIKVVLLEGVCGTGKSAIALHVIKELGKGAVVVPVKGLQKQYEEDYTSKKYLLKKDGRKMRVAIITGRDNHDSIIKPGVSCADPNLPENIKIIDKNSAQLEEYYEQNPYISHKLDMVDITKLRRMAIAPANPYWSPILPASFEIPHFSDAKKRKYMGLNGREFIFYHRKSGCSYYDQYLSYFDSEVLVFNAAKYLAEVGLDRKPKTPVDIIDEADEFLDSLATKDSINLNRLEHSLDNLEIENPKAKEASMKIRELIGLEIKNKQILGVDEEKLFKLGETKLAKIFEMFANEAELGADILIDEWNYANQALEIADHFKDSLSDSYVAFKREEGGEYMAQIVSANLAGKFKEIVEKSEALVLMSGTLHSERVLKDIFGLNNFVVVKAETKFPGTSEIVMTGKEFDCKYQTFKEGKKTREDYLKSLGHSLAKAPRPTLVHINAFEDLPSDYEREVFKIEGIPSKEEIMLRQRIDKLGKSIQDFKEKKIPVLFTTKCARGVDFPGEICNSMVFTKYPNPNVRDLFWRVLQMTHPSYYWEFYRDKARREFLQRMFRALRSEKDHVYVLSPDMRVLDAVRGFQNLGN